MLRTPYFCRSSFDNGADMILRRTCDGALKCALRFFRREDVTNLFIFAMVNCVEAIELREQSKRNVSESVPHKQCGFRV